MSAFQKPKFYANYNTQNEIKYDRQHSLLVISTLLIVNDKPY